MKDKIKKAERFIAKGIQFFFCVLIIIVFGLSTVSCEKPKTGLKDENQSSQIVSSTVISPILVGKGRNLNAKWNNQQNTIVTTSTVWDSLQNNCSEYTRSRFVDTTIDFTVYQVIVIVDELHTNGGWSVDITNITEYIDSIVVTYTNLETGDISCLMTSPYHIVKIPVSNKKVIFQYEQLNREEE
jgi:hypothetical protein